VFRASISPRDDPAAEDLLFGLTITSVRDIRERRAPPDIYKSGVRYQREPAKREYWQAAGETYQLGRGDCEDLAVYACACRIARGESAARAIIRFVRPGLKHCVVRRADGSIEDPSKALGMKGKG
jgi:hypothetical protein